ncbi:hypothetical protein [Campylobacter lanienae]|uniref:hypothetical protein n=1 Tax=Campylobacter lanienae TaxID=75658 RepID=UPI00112FB5DD|nr:hypothetical protein [Campylobacter lanienae]
MRYAFSSIELILSIIIISIALSSIPSIIQISYRSINNILLSEAITASYTKISNIISHPWNNAINPALAQPIYHSDELPLNSLTQRHISQIMPNNINSDKSSINGFSGDSGELIANAMNLLNLDYKIDLKFIDGFELNDIVATSPSDSIQITITTKANNQPIILKSYSYNIGEPLIESLVIPPPQP